MKWAAILICLLSSLRIAQADPLQFLDCNQIYFWGEPCPQREDLPLIQSKPPERREEPLFSKETVPPGTSPLMLAALDNPTPENIRALVLWKQRRLERLLEVDQKYRAFLVSSSPARSK